MRRRIDVVAEHGAMALSNSHRAQQSVSHAGVADASANRRWLVAARTLPKTIAIAVVVLAALLSLFFIPAEFQLHGKGTLEPVVKRDVFAGVKGPLSKVLEVKKAMK